MQMAAANCKAYLSTAADRGGQQGQFTPGPQCEGGPKQSWTLSNKIRFIIHIQSSLLKGLFRCIVDLKSACFLHC